MSANARPADAAEPQITFSLDKDGRIRTALLADPGFDPTINDLVDLSGVTRLDISSSTVRRIAQMFDPLNDLQVQNRLAIVAPHDELFGMARMYEILRAEAPEETKVVRNLEDAMAFLEGK